MTAINNHQSTIDNPKVSATNNQQSTIDNPKVPTINNPNGNPKVLIVDDEPDILKTLAAILTQEGELAGRPLYYKFSVILATNVIILGASRKSIHYQQCMPRQETAGDTAS